MYDFDFTNRVWFRAQIENWMELSYKMSTVAVMIDDYDFH